MRENKEYFRRTIALLFCSIGLYVNLAIRADRLIEDFDYAKWFLLMIAYIVVFLSLELLIRGSCDKRVKKAMDENKPWQVAAKIKTIYGLIYTLWAIALCFFFMLIVRALGFKDIPSTETFIIAILCILVVFPIVAVLYNYWYPKHRKEGW